MASVGWGDKYLTGMGERAVEVRKNDIIGREKLMMQAEDREVNYNKGIFTIVFKYWNKN